MFEYLVIKLLAVKPNDELSSTEFSLDVLEVLISSIDFKHSFSRTSSIFSRPFRQSEKVITNFTFPYSAMHKEIGRKGGLSNTI